MIKLKNLVIRHKIALSFFAFIVIYNFVFVDKPFEFSSLCDVTYAYHLVDFSVGFCTKLLPGAIYNFFFNTTDPKVMNAYFSALYYLFMLVLSFMLEKFLESFKGDDRIIIFTIVMFYITGPATFAIHAYRLGMLDTYWIFLSIIFVLFISNKVLRWWIPVLFALALMIHFSAIISFIPFFALLLLLEASYKKDTKKVYVSIFLISVLVSFVVFAYFLLFEEKNLLMSLDEFKIFIEERNLSEEELYTKYWLYALYKISPVDDVTQMNNAAILGETDIISKYINIIWVQIIENIRVMELLFDNFRYYETLAIFLSIPILIVLYKYVFSELKKSKHNKLRVFALFCTLFILPFTFFSSMFFSPDFTRWFGHGFITLFTLVLYDIYKCEKKLSHLLKLSNNNILILSLVLYFMIYMSFTVDAYF